MKQNKENLTIRLSDIEASLSKGRIYSGRGWVIFCTISIVLSMIMIIVSTIAGVITSDREDIIFCIIMGVLGAIILMSLFAVVLINERYKKLVKVWMKDAIAIEARCTSFASAIVTRFPALFFKATAIEVAFVYNNDFLIKRSENNNKPVYLKIFNKYLDRKIKILYSPKYDQVMFLKG